MHTKSIFFDKRAKSSFSNELHIDKPIFILAPARSGTTVFYNLFTRHKNTAFPEHFIDKHWESSFLMKFVPILVKIQQYRYKQRSLPHEGVFWRKYHDYNSIIDETNIIEEEKKFLHSMIKTQLKAFSANRFVDRSHDFCLRLKTLLLKSFSFSLPRTLQFPHSFS